MWYRILFLLFSFTGSLTLKAQKTDSTHTKASQPSRFQFFTKTPNPKRAGLYSALIPGLGQTYNKQYWKLPIVAAAAGTLTYFISSNRTEYLKFQKDYIYRIDNNPNTVTAYPAYSDDDINLRRTTYRKDYEYSIIAASAFYLVNILDAFTSAHLKTFDMGKDISWNWTPIYNGYQAGIRIVYSFN